MIKKFLAYLLLINIVVCITSCTESGEETDSSNHSETVLPGETSDDIGTDTSDNPGTETSGDIGTETSENPRTETSGDIGTETSENPRTETSGDIGTDSPNPFVSDITIYLIDFNVFYQFIDNTSLNYLKEAAKLQQTCTDGEIFGRWGVPFNINKELINFVGSKSALKKYLASNGITADIEETSVFSAPYIPMTLWVKTSDENFYITIEEETKNGYTYTFYHEAEYVEQFDKKEGILIVNGKDITPDQKIRIHYRDADLPLIAIMEALGSEVDWITETEATLTGPYGYLCLNLTECTLTADYWHNMKDYDMLLSFGSGRFYQVKDRELILNAYSMSQLMQMFQGHIEIDREHSIVTIEAQHL